MMMIRLRFAACRLRFAVPLAACVLPLFRCRLRFAAAAAACVLPLPLAFCRLRCRLHFAAQPTNAIKFEPNQTNSCHRLRPNFLRSSFHRWKHPCPPAHPFPRHRRPWWHALPRFLWSYVPLPRSRPHPHPHPHSCPRTICRSVPGFFPRFLPSCHRWTHPWWYTNLS